MIPKIIHYCWLSNDPFPASINYCINSWKKTLPDYEIMLWDFNRFPKGKSRWVDEAFGARKYAFAADYIRLYALYHYGGIYLDSDVEVVRSFNELLTLPYFMGLEDSSYAIEASTMGFEKGHPLLKSLLERYEGRSFYKEDGSIDNETLPKIIRAGISEGFTLKPIQNITEFDNNPSFVCVFPVDWFSPKSWDTKEIFMTGNTFSIHHFEGSWLDSQKQMPVLMDYNTHPLVSILVPVYNVENYLDRCVDSIVKQSYQKIEIILVDDGSTDNSSHMCDRWAEIDSRIKVIHQDNQGLLLARQSAVKNATGDYCIFLDSDDWLEKNTCEVCVKASTEENVEIVGFGFTIEAGSTIPSQRKSDLYNYLNKKPAKFKENSDLLSSVFVQRDVLWNVCGKMYKSEIVKKAYNYLDGVKCNYAEDMFTSVFIFSFAKSLVTIPNKCYHYRIGTGMSTKKNVDVSDYKTVLEAYDNYNIVRDVAIKNELLIHSSADIFDNIERLLDDAVCSYLVSRYASPDFKEWVKLWEEKIGMGRIVSYFIGGHVSHKTGSPSAIECNSDELAKVSRKSRKHLKNFQKMIFVSTFFLLIIIALVIYILMSR